MRDTLINAYLDYVNNWLTIEQWSESNGLTDEQGHKLISLAREITYSDHPDA